MTYPSYTGRTIDKRYQMIREVGRGGMGSVYLARHVILGHLVAVKLLHGQHTRKKQIVKRFYREAQASAAIGHENIIQVFDVGFTDEDDPYIVMEYLEGESLASMLDRAGPLDLDAACGILEPTLLGLIAAHEKGIVHRDLKPENIFLVHSPGTAPKIKLIDFGISKFAGHQEGTRLTRENAMLGTPAFMAPEQIQGAAGVDGRADVYSAGVILYHMLTGQLPFQGLRLSELFLAILTGEPRSPTEIRPDFPAAALPLVMGTISRNPEDRPQSARELLDGLRALRAPLVGDGDPVLALWTLTADERLQSPAMGHLGEPIADTESDPNGRGVAGQMLDQMARELTAGAGQSPSTAGARTAPGQTVPGGQNRFPEIADLELELATKEGPGTKAKPGRRGPRAWQVLVAAAAVAGIAIGVGLERGIDKTPPDEPRGEREIPAEIDNETTLPSLPEKAAPPAATSAPEETPGEVLRTGPDTTGVAGPRAEPKSFGSRKKTARPGQKNLNRARPRQKKPVSDKQRPDRPESRPTARSPFGTPIEFEQ